MTAFLSKARSIAAQTVGALRRAEVVALTGAALIALGVGQIYPPAGLITGGILLILAAMDSRS